MWVRVAVRMQTHLRVEDKPSAGQLSQFMLYGFYVWYVGGSFSLGRAYEFQVFNQLIVKLLFLNYFSRNFTYRRYFANVISITAA